MTRADLEARILDRMVSWYALLRNTVPEMTDDQLALLEGHMSAALDLLKDTRRVNAPVDAPMPPTMKEFLDEALLCGLCGLVLHATGPPTGDVCGACWKKVEKDETTSSGTLQKKHRRGRR